MNMMLINLLLLIHSAMIIKHVSILMEMDEDRWVNAPVMMKDMHCI